MGDIVRIDGTPIDIDKPLRNEPVAVSLALLTERNDSGDLAGFAYVVMHRDGSTTAGWKREATNPVTTSQLLGAIEILKHDILVQHDSMSVLVDPGGRPEPEPA